MSNFVYIATSLDGYIADKNNKLDWLEIIPNPNEDDLGYAEFMETIDAIVMGRNTYETVLGFGIDWPYSVPVFVCSNSLTTVSEKLTGKVSIIKGTPKEITNELKLKGFKNLYIDGGKTIQNFLDNDLIDEMFIYNFPILLGGGIPLFSSLTERKVFHLVSVNILLEQIVCRRYSKK